MRAVLELVSARTPPDRHHVHPSTCSPAPSPATAGRAGQVQRRVGAAGGARPGQRQGGGLPRRADAGRAAQGCVSGWAAGRGGVAASVCLGGMGEYGERESRPRCDVVLRSRMGRAVLYAGPRLVQSPPSCARTQTDLVCGGFGLCGTMRCMWYCKPLLPMSPWLFQPRRPLPPASLRTTLAPFRYTRTYTQAHTHTHTYIHTRRHARLHGTAAGAGRRAARHQRARRDARHGRRRSRHGQGAGAGGPGAEVGVEVEVEVLSG